MFIQLLTSIAPTLFNYYVSDALTPPVHLFLVSYADDFTKCDFRRNITDSKNHSQNTQQLLRGQTNRDFRPQMFGQAIHSMDKGASGPPRDINQWQKAPPRRNPQTSGRHIQPIPHVGTRLQSQKSHRCSESTVWYRLKPGATRHSSRTRRSFASCWSTPHQSGHQQPLE